MKTPITTMELAGAIESLIGLYMKGVHEAARQAVERALIVSTAGRPPRGGRKVASTPATSANRRTATQLDEACNTLCEMVRAHPGASMVELAERMGAKIPILRRPMTSLKSAGRVRTVGQRNLTRYYPAVVRSSAGKD
jgi:predicted transcriptional regulator